MTRVKKCEKRLFEFGAKFRHVFFWNGYIFFYNETERVLLYIVMGDLIVFLATFYQ
jgi:hypothetical protein